MDLFHLHGVPLMAQAPAIALDQDLMTIPGFSTYQLMELAGLSIASSVYDAYPEAKKVLAIVGPGNNGTLFRFPNYLSIRRRRSSCSKTLKALWVRALCRVSKVRQERIIHKPRH